jgi:predicted pyridoxine 5'-phosphate oxidase superfamily flavin-nucleotide-binding protein
MRAVIRSAHLCFAATVTPDGRPNLSPKGTIRVWDDHSIFFLDIASPKTRANLEANPWMELNVVDQLSRRGYRFSGQATIHREGGIFEKAISIVTGEENTKYPVTAVILLDVLHASAVVSPGYWHVADEHAMRAAWRTRRRELDDEFESYLASRRSPD